MADLDRLERNEVNKFSVKFNALQEFVALVKQECVVEQHYFIFTDVPDLIIKKKYSRKDYNDIIKVLVKVKNIFIAEKALDKGKPV